MRSLRPFPRPPSSPRSPLPDPALLFPFRLRHPPAPHTQDENALPGTTQQRLDGFGHGPAIAYSQHHLQSLRLGESRPVAARLALSLRLRFASTGPAERHCARAAPLPRPSLPRTPHTPHLKDELREPRDVDFWPHHSGRRPLTVLARTSLWHAFLWLEHFLSGMSHSGSSPSPFLFPRWLSAGRGPWHSGVAPYIHSRPLTHTHLRDPYSSTAQARPLSAFPESLAVSLVFCTVRASLDC